MNSMTTSFEFSEEERRVFIKEIIGFFQDERGEEIGVLAAEAVLDFVLQLIGKNIYDRGVNDAKKVLTSRLEDINIDLESLLS